MNWPVVHVSDVADQIRGVTFGRSESVGVDGPGFTPLFTASNITEIGLNRDTDLHIPSAKVQDRQRLRIDDVLITASSGSLSVVGRAVRVDEVDGETFGAFCKVLRPKKTVDPGYFSHFFRTPSYRARVAHLAAGANINNLKNEDLDQLEIPLPPLPEQRRIASILDQAGAIRAKRREALESIDKIADSIFFAFFGDITSNSMQFEELLLGDVGGLDRGVSRVRPRNRPDLLGGVHPLIQTGDVSSSGGYVRHFSQTYSDIGLAQSKMWPVGTLAITIAANIAHTGILTFPACFPDSVVGFTSNPAITEVEYVRYWLRSLRATLERQAPASAQKNINLAILRNLRIPVPRLSVQRLFAEILREIEAIRDIHQTHLAKLDELFASLQHRAFRGEL